MKRGWTKKVKAVPACAASNDALEGRFKPVQPKVKRRVRTSAAMVGLVISMGAPNLLLARQSDRAPAVEPTSNEPTASTVPATTEATQIGSVNSVELQAAKSVHTDVSSSAVVLPTYQVQLKETVSSASPLKSPLQGEISTEPLSEEVWKGGGNEAVAAVISPPAPPVIQHTVPKGYSRSLAQNQVEADRATSVPTRHQQLSEAEGVSVSNLAKPKVLVSSEEGGIALFNNTQYAEIQAEKVLVQKLKAKEIETLSKSYEVKSNEITPPPERVATQPLLDKLATVNAEGNGATSTKQRVLINRLKQKSNRSQDLTQLRFEESNNSLVPTFAQPASTLAKVLTPNEASVDSSVVVEAEAQQNAVSLSPIVTSNEKAISELRQSPVTPAAVVRIPDVQDFEAQTINEASLDSVVVEAEAQQNAASLSPIVTSDEKAKSELRQSPETPAAAVRIPDVQDFEAQTPNEASVDSVVVEAEAQQNAASLSPIVTSNEKAKSELRQSPETPAAAVRIPDVQDSEAQTINEVIHAPQVSGNAEGQNITERALKGKPSPSGILRQAASPTAISNKSAVLEAENVQTTSLAVVVPDVQDAVNEPTTVVASSLDYQVKAGDTLSAIARTHDISVSDLVKTNQLSNPDLIEINQQIKIPTFQYSSAVGQTVTVINRPTQPQTTAATVTISTPKTVLSNQSVFVVPPFSPSANNSSVSASTLPMTSEQTNTKLIASNPAGDSQQENLEVLPEPPAETQSLSAAYSGMGGSISDEIDQLSTPAYAQTQLADSTAVIEPQSNLYVQDLRTDIQKLRQKYYAQPQGGQLISVVNETSTLAAPVQVRARGTTAIRSQGINLQVHPKLSANQPINPEFRVAQAAETLQPTFQKRTPNQPSSAVAPTTKARVATAPSSVDASGAMQSFRVRQVSPELPPLGAVDTYLPKPNAAPLKGYIWPAKGVLTSGYGWRWGRMHRGLDIAAPIGTPIVAAAPGVVVRSGWNSGGYGKLVEIKHADGTFTRYAHNNQLRVRTGQPVEQGQLIAEMGSTGFSTGPHSHFELHPGGKGAVNPIAFLPKR